MTQAAERAEQSRDVAPTVVLALRIALVAYAAVIFTGQLTFWLRHGVWLELPLSEITRPPTELPEPFPLSIVPSLGVWPKHEMSWLGLAKILHWLADLNFAFWCFVASNLLTVPKAVSNAGQRST
jgi:hypothetical protein